MPAEQQPSPSSSNISAASQPPRSAPRDIETRRARYNAQREGAGLPPRPAPTYTNRERHPGIRSSEELSQINARRAQQGMEPLLDWDAIEEKRARADLLPLTPADLGHVSDDEESPSLPRIILNGLVDAAAQHVRLTMDGLRSLREQRQGARPENTSQAPQPSRASPGARVGQQSRAVANAHRQQEQPSNSQAAAQPSRAAVTLSGLDRRGGRSRENARSPANSRARGVPQREVQSAQRSLNVTEHSANSDSLNLLALIMSYIDPHIPEILLVDPGALGSLYGNNAAAASASNVHASSPLYFPNISHSAQTQIGSLSALFGHYFVHDANLLTHHLELTNHIHETARFMPEYYAMPHIETIGTVDGSIHHLCSPRGRFIFLHDVYEHETRLIHAHLSPVGRLGINDPNFNMWSYPDAVHAHVSGDEARAIERLQEAFVERTHLTPSYIRMLNRVGMGLTAVSAVAVTAHIASSNDRVEAAIQEVPLIKVYLTPEQHMILDADIDSHPQAHFLVRIKPLVGNALATE